MLIIVGFVGRQPYVGQRTGAGQRSPAGGRLHQVTCYMRRFQDRT
jgi:hypothetical protein